MPGWRKLLTIEVRDVSRPGILFVTKFVTDDFYPLFGLSFLSIKNTETLDSSRISAPLPSSRSDRI